MGPEEHLWIVAGTNGVWLRGRIMIMGADIFFWRDADVGLESPLIEAPKPDFSADVTLSRELYRLVQRGGFVWCIYSAFANTVWRHITANEEIFISASRAARLASIVRWREQLHQVRPEESPLPDGVLDKRVVEIMLDLGWERRHGPSQQEIIEKLAAELQSETPQSASSEVLARAGSVPSGS
jgi:hypothetical protein